MSTDSAANTDSLTAAEAKCERHELHELKSRWWCFLLLGIAMVLFGIFALSISPLIGLAQMFIIGAVLMIGGVVQLVTSFWAGKWSGTLLNLLVAIFYIAVGYLIIDNPAKAAAIFFVVTAAMLIVSGIFRIVVALQTRNRDWGWTMLSGVVSLALGVVIYRVIRYSQEHDQGPEKFLWLVGLFVGIELIFNGWTWVMMSLGLRASSDDEE